MSAEGIVTVHFKDGRPAMSFSGYTEHFYELTIVRPWATKPSGTTSLEDSAHGRRDFRNRDIDSFQFQRLLDE